MRERPDFIGFPRTFRYRPRAVNFTASSRPDTPRRVTRLIFKRGLTQFARETSPRGRNATDATFDFLSTRCPCANTNSSKSLDGERVVRRLFPFGISIRSVTSNAMKTQARRQHFSRESAQSSAKLFALFDEFKRSPITALNLLGETISL